jgi:hypothetical protein
LESVVAVSERGAERGEGYFPPKHFKINFKCPNYVPQL